ncbi:MAG: fibronectin type III domain-containing protein [Patescibacteria group bacterium]
MFSLGRNFLVFGVVLLFSLCALQGVQAARVHDISYSLAPSTVSVAANHTLIFQTKSVILSGTIRLHLKNVASSFGSIGVNDLDLSYGSSMAGSTQTQLALATTPTESSWTVSFDTANRIITFTYPSSGSATIPADQFVNIAIGTHASNQASGLNQMTNAATTGRKDAALFVGTDAHLFSVGLFSDAALSIPNVSYPASTQAETPAPPPAIPVAALTGGGTTQSQTQTNTQPIQPPTASQDSSTTEGSTTKSGTDATTQAPVRSVRETVPPRAPSRVTARIDSTNSGTAVIEWSNDSSGVSKLILERKMGVSGVFALMREVRPSALSTSDTGLPTQTFATYRLKVIGPDDTFVYSSEASVTTPPKPRPRPSAPTALVAVAQAGAITLTWTDTSTNETDYEIQRRRVQDVDFETVKIIKTGLVGRSPSFTDTEIVHGTNYVYRVRALNDAVASGFSSDAEVALSSDSGITSPPLPRPAPATPIGVKTIADSHQRASLSWTDTSESEVSFQIQRDPKFPEGIGDASGAITLAANSTSFRDLTVEPNTRYQYRVRSVNESVRRAGENYSEWVSVATPLPPPPPPPPPTQPAELTVSSVTASAVSLSWEAVIGADSYTLQRRGPGQTQFADLVSFPPDRVEYIDRTVEGESVYAYRLIATNEAGSSVPSDTIIEKTPTRAFDRKKVQVTFAPPAVQRTIDAKLGSTMETKSKQGGGIAIVVPPAVRAFIEGEDGEDSEERARTVVDTPRLPQDTQQLVGGTSSTLTQQIQSAPTPAQPDKPSTSSFGGGSALVNRDEINLTIRALAPTASLVEGQFGSSALIDKKPGDLRSADGIGPLYVIGATMNSTGAVSVRPQPKTRTATSFFSRIQTAFAALFKIGSDRAFAQETSQSGGALFPSYQTSLPVTKFDPGLSYVFTYSREDVVNVDEKTIRLYSWDVAEDAWIPERSAVDTQTRTVTAQLGHLSIFRLFGEALGIPASAKKEIIVVPSAAIETIEMEITSADFNLLETTTQEPITIAKKKFYTTPNTELSMCIPGKIFKKPIKKLILSVGSVRYPLKYQKQKDCFSALITIPSARGAQDVILKIVYIDDQIQQIRLETEITGEFEARLLTTVVPAAQQVQEAARVTNAAVKVTVEKSEPALQTAAIATVPVVTAANPAILSNSLNLWTYFHHLLLWLLSMLGLRKHRRPWGVVYHAISKNPVDLAIVRLFEAKTNRLIETQVTDKDGRFSFLPPPGEYLISAAKLPLLFPSTLVSARSDGPYQHIYRHEPFTIASQEQIVDLSIPLDPPPLEKSGAAASPLQSLRVFLTNVSRISLVGSFIVSILLALYAPSTLNTVLLFINWLYASLQIFLMVKGEKPWGVVFDARSFKPLPLAAISIFDGKSQKLLRTRLTDYLGRFSFLAPPGDYILSVSKDAYTFPSKNSEKITKYKHPYIGAPLHIKKKNQIVRVNVPLDPQSQEKKSVISPQVVGEGEKSEALVLDSSAVGKKRL